MLNVIAGSTEMFVNVLCPQDKHIQEFRFHWHMRGVDIRHNGQIFNLRGIQQYGKNYGQIAKEYGR